MQHMNNHDIKQILRQRSSFKGGGATTAPHIAAWLPLIMAFVLEIMWVVTPWSSAWGFFSLLGCIFMTGLSLIVGIVLLIKGEHHLHTAGILLGTIILLPFLTWLLLDVFQLHLHLR